MSQFIALLTREHHEHKNAFFWAPLVILVLVLLAGVSIAPQVANLRLDVSSERHVDDDGSVYERQQWRRSSADDESEHDDLDADAGHTAAMGVIGLDVAGRTDQELRGRLQPGLRAIAVPFIWVLMIVSLFGCIACMHDERKDRSILFWKSMPVSDGHTVLSKYVYLAWLAPIATILAILLAQLFSLAVLSTLVEDGMGVRVWSNSGMFVQTIQLLFGFLINGINLLPIFGWFILASVWFNSAPFVWALGVPFVVGVVETIVLGTSFVKNTVVFHAQWPMTTRVRADGEGASVGLELSGIADQMAIFAQGQFWTGAVLGIIFLVAAVILRGRKNEI